MQTVGQARVLREVARQGLLPYATFFASTRPFGTPLGPVALKYVLTVSVISALPARDAFNFLLDLASYPNLVRLDLHAGYLEGKPIIFAFFFAGFRRRDCCRAVEASRSTRQRRIAKIPVPSVGRCDRSMAPEMSIPSRDAMVRLPFMEEWITQLMDCIGYRQRMGMRMSPSGMGRACSRLPSATSVER